MADFTEKMRLRGKAEEDIYFAELDRKLIQSLHEKQLKKVTNEAAQTECMELQNNADTDK